MAGANTRHKVLGRLAMARRAESAFLATSLVAILLLVVGSISVLQLEVTPEANIRTADDALWWALTSITTVGYGDRYPVTSEGRVVAAFLTCSGVGLFGILSGFLAAWFVTPAAKEEQTDFDALKLEVRELRVLLEKAIERGA